MPDKKTLDYYVAELRRIEESRQADTEKEIKKIYKEFLKDLNGFLGNEYAAYSNDEGVLSVAVLQEKARYAKFLQEVDQHLNSITPKVSKTIRSTVEDTYKAVYTGVIGAVQKSVDNEELKEKLKGLSLKPEVMKNAVENPISGLTLPDTLEKHRKEVIYNIKQQINIGLMTGERYDTMAKNVKKAISGNDGRGGSYGKAMNIVRTEVHRVQESGMMDCAEDISPSLEGSGLIYTGTWRNMGDANVRPSYRVHTSKGWKTVIRKTKANHQKMEGQVIKVGDKFDLGNGVFAKCPGSSGTPENDCRCRCIVEYELMTVEEFAKATGKTVEEVRKKYNIYDENDEKDNKNQFTNSDESGIIKSGAISGALNPSSKRAQNHAEQYYQAVRKMKTDCKHIAKNTGYSEDEIKQIKNFIFIDSHDLGDGNFEQFAPSYEMAESWQRLIDGKNIQNHDLTLLKHEIMEKRLMENGYSQDEAHIVTSQKYNYAKEAYEYYDKIKAYNKE